VIRYGHFHRIQIHLLPGQVLEWSPVGHQRKGTLHRIRNDETNEDLSQKIAENCKGWDFEARDFKKGEKSPGIN
jgi:hypothetical protein